MKKRYKIRYLQSIYLQILVIIICSVSILVLKNTVSFSILKKLYYLDWIGIVSIIFTILIYVKRTNQLISPYSLFYIFFILFQFGQSILYAFNIDYEYSIFSYYSNFWDNNLDIVFNGTVYTILCILFFNLGGLLSLKNRYKSKYAIQSQSIMWTGWIMFGVSFVPTIFSLMNEIRYSMLYGYKTSLDLITSNNLVIFFVPSCILLVLYYIKSLRNKMILIFLKTILLLYSIGLFIVGGRTEGVAIVVILILIQITLQNKKLNIIKYMKIGIIGLLLLIIITSVSDFRDESDKSLGQFVQIISEHATNDNPLFLVIGEMGWSANPLYMTMNIMENDFGYKYGESYSAALMTAIPTKLDPTGTIEQFYEKASLGRWLTTYTRLSFGVDYSMIAESFYNFGYYGSIIIVIFGYIFGRIFAFLNEDKDNFSIYQWYIKFALLYAIVTLPRRSFSYFVDQYIYIVIVYFIIMVCINKFIVKVGRRKIL